MFAVMAPPAPVCSPTSAKNAVEASAPLVMDIRATGALQPDERVFDVFTIAKLTCADLTGDKNDEMTVFIQCCTAASPAPLAIFTPDGDGWKLAYRYIAPTGSVKRRGRKLILKKPIYKRTDSLCCPSSTKTYVVRYADGRFQRRAKT